MRSRVPVLAIAALAAATPVLTAQQGARGGEWRWHSGDLGSTKYSPLEQINRENVSQLRIAWRGKDRRYGGTGAAVLNVIDAGEPGRLRP